MLESRKRFNVYQKPIVELVFFQEDIVTLSGGESGEGNLGSDLGGGQIGGGDIFG
ncbi:MAG: hypothetical protein IJX30_02695 [Clostridia bacterium]|nr:hypothetical protein [Clostridia bacterium]